LRSKLALFRRDAAKALAELEPAIPNETGATPLPFSPVFVRGGAQLLAKRGKQAAEAYPEDRRHPNGPVQRFGRSARSATLAWIFRAKKKAGESPAFWFESAGRSGI
jgi:hypothetical protein